jgi:electron transfer flavoprotein alpha subunit
MTEVPTKRPATGRRKVELDPRLAAYKGVWVFVEHERGVTHPVSWELLGEARKLADQLGVEVGAVVLGEPGNAIRRGLSRDVPLWGGRLLPHRRPGPRELPQRALHVGLTHLVDKYQPEILLLGATTLGRDLGGSIATTLATGLTADCTELTIDPENRSLAATRPTFGGSLLCTIQTLNYRPQMATVRPRVMHMPERGSPRSARLIEETLGVIEESIITKVLEYIPDEQQDQAQLAYADIIVSGGRGLKRPENFQLIWDLAKVLGAEVGATRPLIQAGWVTADRQVGQTGKTVRPKLYIAAGISGAIQHRVGMESSDVIIAINEDPNAQIFDFATYGIVGNAMQILPALTDAFRIYGATARRAG